MCLERSFFVRKNRLVAFSPSSLPSKCIAWSADTLRSIFTCLFVSSHLPTLRCPKCRQLTSNSSQNQSRNILSSAPTHPNPCSILHACYIGRSWNGQLHQCPRSRTSAINVVCNSLGLFWDGPNRQGRMIAEKASSYQRSPLLDVWICLILKMNI